MKQDDVGNRMTLGYSRIMSSVDLGCLIYFCAALGPLSLASSQACQFLVVPDGELIVTSLFCYNICVVKEIFSARKQKKTKTAVI